MGQREFLIYLDPPTRKNRQQFEKELEK